MLKVSQIGCYPPPLGGISVHIKRLKDFLEQKGVECSVYTHCFVEGLEGQGVHFIKHSYLFYLFFYIVNNSKIVHYHDLDWRKRLLLAEFKPGNRKLIFTFHSFTYDIDKMNALDRFMMKISYLKADAIISVSQEVKEKLIATGCKEEKIHVLSAVILPEYIEPPRDFELLSEVREFAKSHEYVLTANASANKHFKGEDLYGFDHSIELIDRLNKQGLNAGLLFFVSSIDDKDYFEEINKTVSKNKLESHIKFITTSEEYIAYLNVLRQYKTILIRPTNTDGYAVSITEALHLGIPAIASDVCRRQDGTVIFKTRDIQDLFDKTLEVINNYETYRINTKNAKTEGNAQNLLDIYNSI
jgi:glycosyltransferase involved in cell wall biosynthesis